MLEKFLRNVRSNRGTDHDDRHNPDAAPGGAPHRDRMDVIRHRGRSALATASSHGRQLVDSVREQVRRLTPVATEHGRRALTAATATRRSQALVAIAAVMVLAAGGALTAQASIFDRSPATSEASELPESTGADDDPLAEREQESERSDRGDRSGAESGRDREDSGESRGAAPDESPSPEPKPEPKPEPEPEPEPKPSETAEAQPDWVHPMPDGRTTSCFGQRWGTLHAGVDLAYPSGGPIHTVGAGTVTHAGWVFGGYGISVVIDHHDGHFTHYAHASETRVSVGDKVEPGDVIALEGSTGDSTGPHLHFEVHQGMWNQVEPTQWMSNRGVDIGGC